MPRPPHNLALYEAAVQHPLSEVDFVSRVYRHYFKRNAFLLREDFCGTAAVAAAWCESDPERQAMGVDHHGPTLKWADKRHTHVDDLHLLEDDVMNVTSPRVDIVASLNFSTLVYHDRPGLLAYLKHARRCLHTPAQGGGVFVMDLYGGPDAMRVTQQTRPAETEDGQAFTYTWEQRSYDAVTARTDCRIHFALPGGAERRNAFRYDWRLWTPAEVLGLMHEAGFTEAAVWCDRVGPATGAGDGRYRPVKRLDTREAWVAYLVGIKGLGQTHRHA